MNTAPSSVISYSLRYINTHINNINNMNALQRFSSRTTAAIASRTLTPTTQPLKQLVQSSSRSSNSSSSSSSSSSNKSNNKSYGKLLATLVALPVFISSPEFTSDIDDKENECRPPLRCSSQAIQGPLRSSTGFLTPIAEPQETRLCIGVSMIPHPAKRAKGGEDAYFISDDMKSLGVADGVGGWGDIGVDPALYARMLMASGKYFADSQVSSLRDPVQIMSDAYEHSMDVQGSATCCIVTIDGYCLKTANLGDSGFMVIRGNEIVFRSKEQQHSFNFPYQLGTGSADMPSHAVSITINIQPGDLVILGTDGLFDNLFDDEILDTVSQASEPMTIAQLIARSAHMSACSKTLISPFAKAARENGYPLATGGKLDDITVLVAKVVLTRDGNINFAM